MFISFNWSMSFADLFFQVLHLIISAVPRLGDVQHIYFRTRPFCFARNYRRRNVENLAHFALVSQLRRLGGGEQAVAPMQASNQSSISQFIPTRHLPKSFSPHWLVGLFHYRLCSRPGPNVSKIRFIEIDNNFVENLSSSKKFLTLL